MIELSGLLALETLALPALAKLDHLLAQERAAKSHQEGGLQEISAYSAGPVQDAERNGLPVTVRDNIAIVSLRGIMLKSYPYASSYVASSAHVRAAIKAARLDESIDHIVIMSDTPGGDVRGMHELGDEITAAAQSKNVVVQIEGTLASAGYHVAVGANAIYASHRMNSVGSIGVRTALWDTAEMYENAGIKVIKVDTGEHKSTGLEGVPITEPQVAEVQRVVDQLYAEFLAVIIAGRGITEKELKPLADGRSWFAYEAEGFGLIDAIQPLETTLASLTARQQNGGMTRAAADELFKDF
jgi:protease-4